MTHTSTAAALPAVALLILAAVPASAGVGQLEVVARQDAPAPGGGTFAAFTELRLGGGGRVAFLADLANGGGQGLYAADDGSVAAVVPAGLAYPGGGQVVSEIGDFAVTGSGHVGVLTRHGADGADGAVFWTYDGGVLSPRVREGQALPGGTVDQIYGAKLADGQASLAINLTGGQSPFGENALVRVNPDDAAGVPTALTLKGEALPTGGTIATFYEDAPDGAGGVTVLFLPSGEDNRDREGLLRVDGTTRTVLAQEGQAVAGPGGPQTLLSIFRPTANARGEVAFAGLVGDAGGGSDGAILAADGRSVRVVAVENQVVPGVGELSFVVGHSGEPALSDSGRVAFNASYLPATPPAPAPADEGGPAGAEEFDRRGLFAADLAGSGDLRLIASAGRPAPGGGEFRSFGTPRLNAAGQIAFSAEVATNPGSFADSGGVYWFDDRLGTLKVIAERDVVDGEVVAAIDFDPYMFACDFDSGYDPSADAFNDAGQVAFAYTTVAGGSGVALWTPPDVADLLAGDANLDGVVTIADFAVLRSNFGSAAGYFTTGDFDGDGGVTIADFALLRANFGGSAAQAAELDAWAAGVVPEPAGLGLLAAGGLALRRRRAGLRG